MLPRLKIHVTQDNLAQHFMALPKSGLLFFYDGGLPHVISALRTMGGVIDTWTDAVCLPDPEIVVLFSIPESANDNWVQHQKAEAKHYTYVGVSLVTAVASSPLRPINSWEKLELIH